MDELAQNKEGKSSAGVTGDQDQPHYLCDECGLDVVEQNIRWSSDKRPLCPRCEWPLSGVPKREA